MKKAVLLLAILFLVGILAGGATAVVKRKNDNTPSESVGGGAESSASLEGLETDLNKVSGKETKIQEFGGFGSDDTLTPNTDDGKWALYSDSGYDFLTTQNVLYVENTAEDGAMSLSMSKNYDRRHTAFSASFDMGVVSGDPGIIDSVFCCTLGSSLGTEEQVKLLTIRDGDLYAVDKVKGEVKIVDNVDSGDDFFVYYHVDLEKRSLQVWVNTVYKGAFHLATSATAGVSACSYFGFYAEPNADNVGKRFIITFLYVKI